MRYNRPLFTKFQRAFTLIELLVTITMLGVIMAIALPNLRDFVVANRLSSNVNAFVGMLNYARSEAIVRNKQVIVCAKRDNANGCQTTDDWGKFETQIFVDEDGSDTRNAGDTLIKTFPAIDVSETQFRFKKQDGPNVIKFQSGGFGTNTYRFDINVINNADPAYETKYGRTICISKPGRARVGALTSSVCSAI